MPTYDYRCPRGHEFEEFQSITAEPVAKCPECGRKAKRLISAGAGLIFKGSGFYITDYKKNGKPSGESESKSDKAGDTAKPAEGSKPPAAAAAEAKPATSKPAAD